MLLPGICGRAGEVTLAHSTHGKFGGSGILSIRNVAYGDVVKVLLQTLAAEVVIEKAYSDVVNFRRSYGMTKETYLRML